MFDFTTGMGILAFIGFGFYLFDRGGLYTLLGILVLLIAIGFYFRWERRLERKLFKDG